MFRVIGIVWGDFVNNILYVDVNRCWGFINDFLFCDRGWWVLRRFCRISISYRFLMCVCLVVIGILYNQVCCIEVFCGVVVRLFWCMLGYLIFRCNSWVRSISMYLTLGVFELNLYFLWGLWIQSSLQNFLWVSISLFLGNSLWYMWYVLPHLKQPKN